MMDLHQRARFLRHQRIKWIASGCLALLILTAWTRQYVRYELPPYPAKGWMDDCPMMLPGVIHRPPLEDNALELYAEAAEASRDGKATHALGLLHQARGWEHSATLRLDGRPRFPEMPNTAALVSSSAEEVHRSLEQGDASAAFERVEDLWALAVGLSQDSPTWYLRRGAEVADAAAELDREIRESGLATPAELRAHARSGETILADLERPYRNVLAEAIYVEQMLLWAESQSPDVLVGQLGLDPMSGPERLSVFSKLGDTREWLNDRHARAAEILAVGSMRVSHPRMRELDAQTVRDVRERQDPVAELFMISGTEALENYAAIASSISEGSARAALAAYHADNGDYPASPSDLVPSYLTAEPFDPWTGHALLYQKLPNQYLLYSADADGHALDPRPTVSRFDASTHLVFGVEDLQGGLR
jgi:hypothetical protein